MKLLESSSILRELSRQNRFVPKKNRKRKSIKIQKDNSVLQQCLSDYSVGRFKIKKGEIHVISSNNFIGFQKKKRKSISFVLIHRPTGVCIDSGNFIGVFSKQQIRKIREELIQRYLLAFEYVVKRHLRSCMIRQLGLSLKDLEFFKQ